MRSATVRRTVAAALVAGALGTAVGTAQAAPVQDDFSQGTHDKTALVGGVAIELTPAFDTTFEGPALPTGFTSGVWDPDPLNPGTATADDGLILDRAWAKNATPVGPGSSLRFRTTFDQAQQHVGFGVDLQNGPWAAFSTAGNNAEIYARVNTGSDTLDTVPQVLVGTQGETYDFRIDWTATGFVFWVDGVQKATLAGDMTGKTLAPMASDKTANRSLPVESMSLLNAGSGTWTSRTFDAGDARVSGFTLGHEETTPAGTSITYTTQSSADNVNWTAWSSPNATPPARYLRYRATLSTDHGANTPRLTAASVDFKIDTTAPTTSIGTIAVTGNSAKVPFSSDDASATYECSLDGGAYAACSNPAQLGNLQRRHSHRVGPWQGRLRQRRRSCDEAVRGHRRSGLEEGEDRHAS